MDPKARRHFDAIARAMNEDDDARRRDAMTLSAEERVRIGFELAQPFIRTDPAVEAELDRLALGQVELHRTWRRLEARRKAERE